MKNFLLVVVLFHTTVLAACECPPIIPVNQELAKKYDVIFTGKVDSVSDCTAGISKVYFTIEELYKGRAMQQMAVQFDCVSSCLMSFAKNEEWIIYAAYQQKKKNTKKQNKHSRKYFKAGEQDFYLAAAGRTFEEEKEFLRSGLGIQPFV